jgi:hypothetical protein
MEISVTFRTMREKELLERADAFAHDLVTKLDRFNEENPHPKMDAEAWERFRERYKDEIPGPTPQQMIGTFKNSFCRYMESQYGIIP